MFAEVSALGIVKAVTYPVSIFELYYSVAFYVPLDCGDVGGESANRFLCAVEVESLPLDLVT